MGIIRGIDVTIYDRVRTGTDGFGRPVYDEVPEVVRNVLVQPGTASEVLDTLNLTGKKAVYTMAIPKGDTHEWRNRRVTFFGQDFMTFGEPVRGIDDLIPMEWNQKVKVEVYEQ